MVPVRLYIDEPNRGDEGIFIDTNLPVVPQVGDTIILRDFEFSLLSNDFAKRMAELMNSAIAFAEAFEEIGEPYPISTNRPIEDYKNEVISAIKWFIWCVDEVCIGTQRIYVYLILK